MAKYTGSVCRLCRRENQKLFLKGDRCFTEKCSFERRSYPPGQHGQGRVKFSEYGLQLREKQKAKRLYGMLEKQFKSVFSKASQQKGVTGDNFLKLLERRFDNVVYRAGLASSRAEARQLILHGHYLIDAKKVNIPSFRLSKGQKISVADKSLNLVTIRAAIEGAKRREIPQWLESADGGMSVVLRDMPSRDDITMPLEERLIVELYSK